MPVYEYTCTKCEHEFELLVFGTKPRVRCPECRGSRVKKRFSVFGTKTDSGFRSSAGGECGAGSCGSCAPTG
ncbi:MAG: zinc ribbon domain-containing protein [Planctomycetes bacterium]|nr:zinc ribbon domain-containing protein [Planctomycetota bacterium]